MIAIILKFLTGGLLDKITDLGKAYIGKEISEAQFRAEVEKAMAETAASIAESQQATIRSSPVLQRMVAGVVMSQVLVLLLYQFGGPLWPMITGVPFPEPTVTIEWAYALVTIGIGGLAMMKR